MALNKIIPKIELDTHVMVFISSGQFFGKVGESAHPETSLTLHTGKGVMYIELSEIQAIRVEQTTI
ncbi:hypothetical protein [Pseudomonas sp. P8_250]|uniref:hypothetical protein n=1 Tax=Pseudomonas sp. P8_250 TaxID=3043446 RepID=UPI002A367B06|nr:hypothetical protein [Pseudomonas sp. P8_250]MDX9668724.1 hypothetical protein [Pseudomonas sp. P8_250]